MNNCMAHNYRGVAPCPHCQRIAVNLENTDKRLVELEREKVELTGCCATSNLARHAAERENVDLREQLTAAKAVVERQNTAISALFDFAQGEPCECRDEYGRERRMKCDRCMAIDVWRESVIESAAHEAGKEGES